MSGVMDIYANNKYKWTQGSTEDVPYIQLVEYKNETDSVIQKMIYLRSARDVYTNINSNIQSIGGSFGQVYKNLYKVKPTCYIFKLPYLNKEGYTLDTSYAQIDPTDASTLGEKFQKVVQNVNSLQYELGDQIDTMQAFINGVGAGSGEEEQIRIASAERQRRKGTQLAKQAVKGYSATQFGQYSTTFSLLNEDDTKIKNHRDFIDHMLVANVPDFINITALRVPVLYSIEISGLYNIPLGFISNFTARPKGNVRYHSKMGYVPDAWEIHMKFNSLFPISKQILELKRNTSGPGGVTELFEEPQTTDASINTPQNRFGQEAASYLGYGTPK